MKEHLPKITRRRLLHTFFFTAGIATTGLLLKAAADTLDETFKPTFVLGGNAAPEPENKPLWQPRTDWKRK